MEAPLLVSTEWLAAHLDDPAVRVVDARWSLLQPAAGRTAHAEGHVPGAVFLDLDADLAAPRGEGPGRHPLPSPERFARAMSRAGVGADTHVVAYDAGDASTAARVWWLLRHFGHERVSVLDGGMAAWLAGGRALETGTPRVPAATFVPGPGAGAFVGASEVEAQRRDPRVLLLDVRAPERYAGLREPVDPVAGHVPGARSRPVAANVRSAEDPRFRPPAELRAAFLELGADRAERVICYCGSGVNACQALLALAVAGFGHGVLYEGSWSDWCSDASRPVATGPEPGA